MLHLWAATLFASSVPIENKISNPGHGHPTYRLGRSVAVDGETMVTGAPFSRVDYFTEPGVARVYTRNAKGTWVLQQELLASPLKHNINFGTSVAIAGDTVVVGGRGEDESAGAVYVFSRTNGKWTQQARLVASDRANQDLFGSSVAISGDLIVVGAAYKDERQNHEGAAYVYKRSDGVWTQQAKMIQPETSIRSGFGTSVSVSDNRIAVMGQNRTVVFSPDGAQWQVEADIDKGDMNCGGLSLSGDTLLIGRSGEATFYIWNGTQWTPDYNTSVDNFNFGRSVSVQGDVAIVGACAPYQSDTRAGTVYTYRRSEGKWAYTGRVQANDAVPGDSFGRSVALSGDIFVAGADDDSTAAKNSGAAYLFSYVKGLQLWRQKAKFTALNAAAYDYFGADVAINGNTAFVGAPGDNDMGLRNGSVFVFRNDGSGFTKRKRITLSNGLINESFGASIDVSGDTLIASAHGRGVGAAYVFQGGGTEWNLQGELIPPDLKDSDEYAYTVAISGDTAAVSAYGDNYFTGAVYIFTRNAGVWSLQTKIKPASGASGLNFGESIALDGDRLVVGAPGGYGGYAYVFTRKTQGSEIVWKESRLKPTGVGYNDFFGQAVDIWGNTIIVGTDYDDYPTMNSGSAYVFTRDGANYIQSAILSPVAVPSKRFGCSVALDRDTAIIGAYSDDEKGNLAGAAYMFKRTGDTWTEKAKLTASDAAELDHMGMSVAVDGLQAIVGAYRKSDPDPHSGAAYVFQLPTAVGNWMKY